MSAARDERPHRPADDGSTGSRRERPLPPSDSPRLEAVVDRLGAITGRLTRVWRTLSSERRLAAFAAIGLFVTLFLPWYQETVIARGVTSLRSLSDSLTGWGAFSFVEAAVLLVAAGVLLLLFVRAEGQAFHVPGGDGTVITTAGAWACVLIIWRMFDKEGTTGHGLYSTSSGIEWGIFVALAVAGLLTYAGTRIRLAHDPEPPLPDERPRRRRGRRGGRRTDATSRRPVASTSPDWVAEDDIEETWLQLERDLPRRTEPPPVPGSTAARSTAPGSTTEATSPLAPAANDATTRVTPPTTDATAPLSPPADATAPLSPPADPTAPLSPPAAAPTPRRRRPRSIAEPVTPSPEDQATARLDRRD
ncbi:MAG TPA: hypothetical protein VHW04_02310 [Solirubrobacteraceae bacterium]|nr:hypothetical protein [Solirubrobacteraceae bacterium]